jgi:hypothetical protein
VKRTFYVETACCDCFSGLMHTIILCKVRDDDGAQLYPFFCKRLMRRVMMQGMVKLRHT